MIANLIAVQFERVGNWPLGAALALTSMAMVAPVAGLFVAAARAAVKAIK
jgi:spermidine/putrescine transport system permease protein